MGRPVRLDQRGYDRLGLPKEGPWYARIHPERCRDRSSQERFYFIPIQKTLLHTLQLNVFNAKLPFFRDNLTEIDGMTERLDKLLSGGKHLTSPDSLTNDFRNLLETSLWGNKCDLSISAGNKQVIASLLQIKTWPKLPTPTLFYVFPTFNHR